MKSTAVSYGYLTPAAAHFRPDPWFVTIDGLELREPEFLPDWHYFAPVRVGCRLDVDVEAVLRDCNLAEDATLHAVIAWHSTWTNLRGVSTPLVVAHGLNEVELELSGEMLGGRLEVDLRCILGGSGSTADPLAPSRPGSVLWNSVFRTMMDGNGSRFPIIPLDFSKSIIAEGRAAALWCLKVWTSDLDASAAGALSVYLNTGHPRVAQLLQDPRSERSADLMQMIHFDVSRQLVHWGLRQENLDLQGERDSETLGGTVRNLLDAAFPEAALDEVRALRDSDPGEFEAVLQARTGVFAQ